MGIHPNDGMAHNFLNANQAAPDPNPSIPCARCETERGFQDYWEERYVEPDDVDPHETEWLCDECKRLNRREEQNHTLAEVVE